jgi:hypothetical protein
MKALQTRMLGYAPDERDREYPPEVVYWTEPSRNLFLPEEWRAPTLWVTIGIDAVICALFIYLVGGAHFHLW